MDAKLLKMLSEKGKKVDDFPLSLLGRDFQLEIWTVGSRVVALLADANLYTVALTPEKAIALIKRQLEAYNRIGRGGWSKLDARLQATR